MKLPRCKPVKGKKSDYHAHRVMDGVVLCGADGDQSVAVGYYYYCNDCNEVYRNLKKLHIADDHGAPACHGLPERVMRFATVVDFSETLASHKRKCGEGCSVVKWCYHCYCKAQRTRQAIKRLEKKKRIRDERQAKLDEARKKLAHFSELSPKEVKALRKTLGLQ